MVTPGGGIIRRNSSGQPAYRPLPAGGHRDTTTAYPLPFLPCASTRGTGTQAARAIAQAATMQARLMEHTKADPPAIPRSSGPGVTGS